MADGNAVQDARKDSRGDDRGRTSPVTFFRQVVAELRKVVWPTQQQLITYFFVVLVFVIVLMTLGVGPRPRFRKAGLRGLHRRHQHPVTVRQ